MRTIRLLATLVTLHSTPAAAQAIAVARTTAELAIQCSPLFAGGVIHPAPPEAPLRAAIEVVLMMNPPSAFRCGIAA